MRSLTGPWLVVVVAVTAAVVMFVPQAQTQRHLAAEGAFLPTQAATESGAEAHPLVNPCTGQPFTTIMTNAGFKDVQAGIGGSSENQYVVNFTLADNDEAKRFATFTKTHIGQPLAIVLDGKVLSAPVIQAELTTGGQITGNFSQEQAQTLALQLKSGALPLPVTLVSTTEAEGGLQLVLQVGSGQPVSPADMEKVHSALVKRLTLLGINSPDVAYPEGNVAGSNQVIITLPGTADQPNIEAASRAVQSTGLLEFVDFSASQTCHAQMPFAGQYILTDVQLSRSKPNAPPSATPEATLAR